jgi:RNA polymerase sigma-70 factor (ECF subfamily)
MFQFAPIAEQKTMAIDSDMQKEKELIERIKRGERSAFDALVDAYRDRGFAIAYSLVRNPEDAKDILQEGFIRVYMKIKSFRSESKFSTWFHRILVNSAIDFLRRRNRKEKVFVHMFTDTKGREIDAPDQHSEPVRIIQEREFTVDLERCISALPERQRVCFILKHQNGLDNMQISQITGCGLSTVKVHLFRAARNLRRVLVYYIPE